MHPKGNHPVALDQAHTSMQAIISIKCTDLKKKKKKIKMCVLKYSLGTRISTVFWVVVLE